MRLPPPDPPGSFRIAALHLAGLSALAIAQPLFDLLSRNVEFLAVRGSTRWDVVLFAFGIVVLPPLLLVALEALAGLAHGKAATVLHLAFLALLLGLLVLQALHGLGLAAVLLLGAAAAAGAAGALLYTRVRPARTLLSVVGAAPLLFLVLFLFLSPASRLLDSPPEPELAQAPSGAPVVMVVLDELPTVSLMRADGEIDAERYPNFARLAGDATWYRNTTTVHEWTTGAVPAMLTGRRPEGLPLFLDHPDNLFTLLGGAYDLDVFESQTHLCPPELCDPDREPLPQRVGSLLSDLSVVYGHLVLPEDLADELPSISTAWRDFGDGDSPEALLQEGPAQLGGRPAAYTGRDAEVQELVESLGRSDRPTLSFLHVLLPHHPWEYLPNGKIYASDLGFQPGLENEGWVGDPELAIQAHQRHLLQVGYTDLALGRILDRLEETGLYDESLVIVAADHGVSFRPHGERRRIEEGNMEEIAFVPLFVKPPGQTQGRIDDRHARTIDIVPTIADILGVEVPGRPTAARCSRPARATPRSWSASPRARSSRATPTSSSSGATASSSGRSSSSATGPTSPASSASARGPTCSGSPWTGSPRARPAGRPSRAPAEATTTPTHRSPPCASTGGSSAPRPGRTSRSRSTAASSPSPAASGTTGHARQRRDPGGRLPAGREQRSALRRRRHRGPHRPAGASADPLGRRAGRVLFPAQAPAWRDELVEELASFPTGRHDDTVDALVYALEQLRTFGTGRRPRSAAPAGSATTTRLRGRSTCAMTRFSKSPCERLRAWA